MTVIVAEFVSLDETGDGDEFVLAESCALFRTRPRNEYLEVADSWLRSAAARFTSTDRQVQDALRAFRIGPQLGVLLNTSDEEDVVHRPPRGDV